MPAQSLRALLAQSIDYAGLFPPCSLALEPALRNQARYTRDEDSWMLGSFVLPFGKFGEAKKYFSQFDQKYPLRISALGAKTKNAAAFMEELSTMMQAMRAFSNQNAAILSITQLEMPLPPDADGALLSDARSILEELPVFWETTPDASERTIAMLKKINSGEKATMFGYKLRTGGVTADAFPTSEQIARALIAAARDQVPIKFTAGLHHPVRMFRSEVETKMHGFLNVLGAAILAAEHNWNESQVTAVLDDENASSFSFGDDFFAWQEWKITTERTRARRKLVTSFGSCSFDEPREDLRSLNILG